MTRRRAIWTKMLALLWLGWLPIGWTGPVEAQEPGPTVETVPTLTVQGSAQVRVEPDRATVTLGVLTQEPTAAEAQAEANRIAGAILESLRQMGIPATAIRTSELQLSPVYSQQDPRAVRQEEPRIVAYRASNLVTVQLEDLTRIGPVIDAGLAAGANRLEGVGFSLEDDLPAREQALARAVSEARTKAGAMAEALGVRLVGVLDATEGGVSIDYPVPRFSRAKVAFEETAMDMAPTPVAPGQITVSAHVTLRYRIDG